MDFTASSPTHPFDRKIDPKGIDSSWWRTAEDIIQTSNDFTNIKVILKIYPNPVIAALLLSKQSTDWLNTSLDALCDDEGIKKPSCDSPQSTAKAIVGIIRPRPYGRRWSGDWIFQALPSSDIRMIAKEFDRQIYLTISTFTFSEWVALSIGHRNDFLDTVSNFRNELAKYVREHPAVDWRLLHQALQQPLSRWVVWTAISYGPSFNPSKASDALRFLDPIQQLFEKSSGPIQLVSQLSFLEARFKLKTQHIGIHEEDGRPCVHNFASDPTFDDTPLSTDFSFWESLQTSHLKDLALSNTKSVVALYFRLSPADALSGMRDIVREWSNLSNEFLTCFTADKRLAGRLIELAEDLLDLRNVYSATALGMGLWVGGFRPHIPPKVWAIISPEDDFAGCRLFMSRKPCCLPCPIPHIIDLQSSKGAPTALATFYQFVGYGGFRHDIGVWEKVVGERRIVDRDPPNHIDQISQNAIDDANDHNYLKQIAPLDHATSKENPEEKREHDIKLLLDKPEIHSPISECWPTQTLGSENPRGTDRQSRILLDKASGLSQGSDPVTRSCESSMSKDFVTSISPIRDQVETIQFAPPNLFGSGQKRQYDDGDYTPLPSARNVLNHWSLVSNLTPPPSPCQSLITVCDMEYKRADGTRRAFEGYSDEGWFRYREDSQQSHLNRRIPGNLAANLPSERQDSVLVTNSPKTDPVKNRLGFNT